MISEREKLIGARLRAFRETIQIPRSKFAVTAGFGSERIASYESGRAPLPYEVFRAVTQRYYINPFWLATSVGSPKLPEAFDDAAIIGMIRPRALFSAVYDAHLAAKFKSESLEAKTRFGRLEKVHQMIAGFLGDESLPMAFRETIAEKYGRNLDALVALAKRGKYFKKKVATKFEHISQLTDVTAESNVAGVKSEISETQRLRDDLKCATAKPGMKAALARFMEVEPPRVSEWLAGQEPGGEYALKLRLWADEQLGHKTKK